MDNILIVPPETLTLVSQGSLDQWVPIIAMLVGIVWTVFKSSDAYRSWRTRVSEEKFDAAIRALEAGVQSTYDNYVRRAKAEAPDRKLTNEQRSRARFEAIQHAVSVAPARVDVIKELGGHSQAISVVEEIVQERQTKK